MMFELKVWLAWIACVLCVLVFEQSERTDCYGMLWQFQGFPNRTYYITGHSLGGGIAKLVAAEVLRQELKKPGGENHEPAAL